MSALERVTDALSQHGCTQKGRDWTCPAHEDNSPSLSVTQGDDRVLIHCHAGCDTDAILTSLGMKKSELFDTPLQAASSRIDHTYDYVDEGGTLVYQVVRFEPKDFRQRRPLKGGGWEWKLNGTTRVPYRLPAVLEAVAEGVPVWITEGEKDADAFFARGEVATCNSGGAGKWDPGFDIYFAGAHVTIVADNDKPGIDHARDVYALLVGVAASVEIMVAAAGKDATDHFAAGFGFADFRPLDVASAEVIVADEIITKPKRVPTREVVPKKLDVTKLPPPPEMLTSWLYAKRFTVLKSEPGEGKTWVALWMCLAIMREGRSVLYLDEEGGEDLIMARLFFLGASQEMVDNFFVYVCFDGRTWSDSDVEDYDILIEKLQDEGHDIALAVLDSLADFLTAAGLSEDSSTDVTTFVHRVLGLFRSYDIGQLVLDHDIKQQEANGESKKRSRYSRGSGAKLAKADTVILLEIAVPYDRKHSGAIRLWKTKDRLGGVDLPNLTEPAKILQVEVTEDHMELRDPTSIEEALFAQETDDERDERATGQILSLLAKSDGPLSINMLLKSGVTYRRTDMNGLLRRLAAQGKVVGGRRGWERVIDVVSDQTEE